MYQKDIKESNENKIFRFIFDTENSFSISDIAKATDMTFPTAKRVVDKFINSNIIYEWTLSKGGIGRRAVEYKYNSEFCYLIGCGVDGEKIKLILTNAKGKKKILKNFNCKGRKTFEVFKEALKNFITELDEKYKSKIMGIGLSIPGIYSKENGFFEIQVSEKESIEELKKLEKEIKFPIWIENESNMSVLTEAIIGKHKKLKDFTVITINNNVTCSTYNKMDSNDNEYFFKASRLNHMIMDFKTGKKIGDFISFNALREMVKEKFDIEEIDVFFKNKDYIKSEEGQKIIEKYTFYLSVVIKNLIFTYNPEKLIISGEISKYSNYFLKKLIENVYAEDHIFYRGKETLVFSNYSGESNIIGAAIFALVDKMM